MVCDVEKKIHKKIYLNDHLPGLAEIEICLWVCKIGGNTVPAILRMEPSKLGPPARLHCRYPSSRQINHPLPKTNLILIFCFQLACEPSSCEIQINHVLPSYINI